MRFKIFVAFVVAFVWMFGFGSGYVAGRASRHPPQAESPLSVTIIDDGGTKLKVESKIVEEK